MSFVPPFPQAMIRLLPRCLFEPVFCFACRLPTGNRYMFSGPLSIAERGPECMADHAGKKTLLFEFEQQYAFGHHVALGDMDFRHTPGNGRTISVVHLHRFESQ